jgi:hypothetical protein
VSSAASIFDKTIVLLMNTSILAFQLLQATSAIARAVSFPHCVINADSREHGYGLRDVATTLLRHLLKETGMGVMDTGPGERAGMFVATRPSAHPRRTDGIILY